MRYLKAVMPHLLYKKGCSGFDGRHPSADGRATAASRCRLNDVKLEIARDVQQDQLLSFRRARDDRPWTVAGFSSRHPLSDYQPQHIAFCRPARSEARSWHKISLWRREIRSRQGAARFHLKAAYHFSTATHPFPPRFSGTDSEARGLGGLA